MCTCGHRLSNSAVNTVGCLYSFATIVLFTVLEPEILSRESKAGQTGAVLAQLQADTPIKGCKVANKILTIV